MLKCYNANTMIKQYRLTIGCSISSHASLSKSCEYVRAESKNVISVYRHSVHFAILLVLLTFLCKAIDTVRGGGLETGHFSRLLTPTTRVCRES